MLVAAADRLEAAFQDRPGTSRAPSAQEVEALIGKLSALLHAYALRIETALIAGTYEELVRVRTGSSTSGRWRRSSGSAGPSTATAARTAACSTSPTSCWLPGSDSSPPLSSSPAGWWKWPAQPRAVSWAWWTMTLTWTLRSTAPLTSSPLSPQPFPCRRRRRWSTWPILLMRLRSSTWRHGPARSLSRRARIRRLTREPRSPSVRTGQRRAVRRAGAGRRTCSRKQAEADVTSHATTWPHAARLLADLIALSRDPAVPVAADIGDPPLVEPGAEVTLRHPLRMRSLGSVGGAPGRWHSRAREMDGWAAS